MRSTTRMTVALSMCLLGSVVGAAFLPPGDQYSPQQLPYEKDGAREPREYQNWLEYHRNPRTQLETPGNKPVIASPRATDLSRERNTRKDSAIQELDLLSLVPGSWKLATSRVVGNFTKPEHSDIVVPVEATEIHSASHENLFETDDTFQDQGPGSVEVYKLDLHRENPILVTQSKRKYSTVISSNKRKIPKKAKADEFLWKLKPVEPSKISLPAILRQPSSVYSGETISRELRDEIEKNRNTEVSAVGGVPELQVGCEGLETADRKRRSNDEEYTDDEYWPRFKDPVYKESTEPVLLRVTPIVLDFEDEPPAGQTYEELDELLKLKSTTPEPTTRRTNRGDIDPDLENYQLGRAAIEVKLPERGDLGPSGKDSSRNERSIREYESQDDESKDVKLKREAIGNVKEKLFHLTARMSVKDDDSLSTLITRSESLNHHGSRKLLQYSEKEVNENLGNERNRREVNGLEEDDLWGFAENDGTVSSDENESKENKLGTTDNEKRRREYERRRLEESERRRGEHERRNNIVDSEIKTIRDEYERQQEQEQRDRQRGVDERRKQEDRRQLHEEQRRIDEATRRQSEEAQRRREEDEERRNPTHSRRRDQEQRHREWMRRKEEEERRVRLEDERRNQVPPSSMTRPSSVNRTDNRSRNRHPDEDEREEEERKLREYIERNRPINVKKNGRNGNRSEEQRKHIEEQRRRRIEDERRRQESPENEERRKEMENQRTRDRADENRAREDERRRQMEEQRRRERPDENRSREDELRQREEQRRRDQPDENERRRNMEEQRRRERPDKDRAREEERRRQMEEQRRTDKPDENERRRHMEEQRRRDRPDEDRVREEERRKQMEEQRRRQDEDERRRQMEEQRRREQPDENERRRQMEEQRRRGQPTEDRRREDERQRQMEEQKRRDRPNDIRARDEESRRKLEEERKLQDYVRRNQPVNVPKTNSSQQDNWENQRQVINEARQWERNRQQIASKNDGRSHGPAAPMYTGQRQSQEALEERRKFEEEGRRLEEEYRRKESRRHEDERLRLEAQRRREENDRRRPESRQDTRRPMSTSHSRTEVRDRDAGELRKHETSQRLPDNSRNDPAIEWRRRSEDRERQRQQQEERIRIENERNSRINERRRPQQGNTGRVERVRSQDEAERRRREEARLSALPVSARIIVRADERYSKGDEEIPPTNIRQSGKVGSRDGFGNDIEFPAINPNRPGLAAGRFPVPPTQRPPIKSPNACVWAIVNCCPANKRLNTCFESMGCPGGHWDPNPCRPAIASAAQEEVLNFYEKAENNYTRG